MTDLEIIECVLNGEIDAYNEVLIRYELAIYKFVFNIIKNEDVAKDVTQEVFITAYYNLHTFKHKYKFSSWLFQIATNKSIDLIRKNKKTQEVNIDSMAIRDFSMSPEHFVEFKETKKKLEDFINTLSKVEQKILILRYSQKELTFKDIAEVLKINESTLKYKYYKIYKKYDKYVNSEKGAASCYEL
ncbi:RNA polymerase sigma factor [Clostridium tagluense]|uniref:RNA polymerase sigma factor n=1 Tax=Clostridium tagluense TaxID=360422 RepID=UPI001CF1BB2B|nr:sigma-70 family RNA polymerase sigma factor [Clostridium tagluense]MCB2296198.1 sigma-70 family RNA polymerase sigma factor [Clostridium tagluense]